MTGHPAYGQVRAVTRLASVLLAGNPGPMTLDGTNTWLIGPPDGLTKIVVDPGPITGCCPAPGPDRDRNHCFEGSIVATSSPKIVCFRGEWGIIRDAGTRLPR